LLTNLPMIWGLTMGGLGITLVDWLILDSLLRLDHEAALLDFESLGQPLLDLTLPNDLG
jgi:hypothetical protein